MNSNFKKSLVYFVISSITVMSMAACGNKEEVIEPVPDELDLGSVVSSVDPSEATKYAYNSTIIDYDEVNGNNIICNNAYGLIDGEYAVVSTVNDSSDDYKSKLYLSKLNVGSGVKSSTCLSINDDSEYVPEEITNLVNETNVYLAANYPADEYTEENYQCSEGYSNIYITEDGGVIGVVEYYYSFYSAANYSSLYTTESYLCKWDKNGNLKWTSKVRDKELSDYVTISNSVAADGKYILVTSINNADYVMRIYDSNGSIICNQAVLDSSDILKINDVIKAKDGKYVAFYMDNVNVQKAAYIDMSAGTISGSVVLPDYLVLNGYESIATGSDCDFVFSDYIGMYACNFGSTSFEVMMDYANSDFTGIAIEEICFSGDKFYGVYSDLVNYSTNIAEFNPGSATDSSTKAMVVLGSYKLPASSRKEILDFNRTNEIYRILVKEYSYYDTINENLKGVKMLEEEILSDIGPDMVMIEPGLVNTYSLANNGKLIPWSYLVNADTSFSSADYMEPILDAYAINGLDYIFVYDFRFRTYIGNADIVGRGTSWSVKDFTKAIGKASSNEAVLYVYNSKSDFLDNLICFNTADYIDFENKKCKFNSADFIDMLNFGAGLPDTPDTGLSIYSDVSTSYRDGNILLKEEIMVEADAFWKDAYRLFDGNAGVVGFPGSTSLTSVIEYVDTPIMIINGGNISGAWTFTKNFFVFNRQSSVINAIPVSYTAFDAWGNRVLTNQNYVGINELGESYSHNSTYYYDGSEYEIPEMTNENINSIKSMILSSAKASCYDYVIIGIIEEEANKCFAGSQTAKQAATNIDSRVSAYLFD